VLKKYLIKTILIVAGGVAGFAYYYYIGCHSGSCPITSNPYISTGYGMVIGLVIGLDSGKREKAEV
jgi:hypothetical protein